MAENQYMQPFFDSLSQGVQVAQHLTAAAQQHQEFLAQQQMAQQAQDLRTREFQAQQQQSLQQQLANGAQPVDASGNTSVAGGPAPVASPTPAFSSGGASAPSPTAAPSFTPQQSSDPLTGAGQSGLPAAPAGSVAADPGRTYQVAGQTLQAPTLQDQLLRETQMEQAREAARRVPISDKLADAIGLPRGSTVTPEHLGGIGALAHWMNPPAQDNTPTPWKSEITKGDDGKQTNVITYSDGSIKEVPIAARGKSDKFDPANAAANAANEQTRALTENQRQESANKALKDYQTLLDQKNEIEAENKNIGIALQTGKHYVDKDGHLTAFNKGGQTIADDAQPGYRDAMRARLAANVQRLPQITSDIQGAQNRYADLSRNEGARPQTGAAAPAKAETPAKSTPASAPKVVTTAQLQKYAAAKKIPLAQAKQEFVAAKYTVQQ